MADFQWNVARISNTFILFQISRGKTAYVNNRIEHCAHYCNILYPFVTFFKTAVSFFYFLDFSFPRFTCIFFSLFTFNICIFFNIYIFFQLYMYVFARLEIVQVIITAATCMMAAFSRNRDLTIIASDCGILCWIRQASLKVHAPITGNSH